MQLVFLPLLLVALAVTRVDPLPVPLACLLLPVVAAAISLGCSPREDGLRVSGVLERPLLDPLFVPRVRTSATEARETLRTAVAVIRSLRLLIVSGTWNEITCRLRH